MPESSKTWTLLNKGEEHYSGQKLRDGLLSLADNSEQSVQPVLQGGRFDGFRFLHVRNGDFSFSVLPLRGMGIWRAEFKGEAIGWQSPVCGPVHPSQVDLGEPSGLGWLDGFDELLVRCGLESNGAPEFNAEGRLAYPLHGRIANKPARELSVSIDGKAQEITVVGVVDEVRFHFLKLRMTTTIKTKAGEKGFRIHDRIENLSESPAEFQMLYHTNLGVPLLDAGSKVVVPIKRLVPRNDHAAAGLANWDSYQAPQPGFEEQVYFMELLGDARGNTEALLRNAHGTRGVSLIYNTQQLPCFSVWKNTTSEADGYVTGIEPGTNFPNPRSFEGEQGRVVKLPPSGLFDFHYGFAYHSESAEVEAVEKAIARLQGDTAPRVDESPQSDWCA